MQTMKRPPAVSFIARSGTGKTTLLTALIREFKQRGYRIGAIKHDAHRFEIDKPGKDSYRFTDSGADSVLISSAGKLAFVKQNQPPPEIEELLCWYFPDVDLVLVEGFKQLGLPKIEVHRQQLASELITREEAYDSSLLAVATDADLQVDVPCLDLNDPSGVADFIVTEFSLRPYGAVNTTATPHVE